MCYDSPPATSARFARSSMNALFSIHFSVCLLVQLLVPFFQRLGLSLNELSSLSLC